MRKRAFSIRPDIARDVLTEAMTLATSIRVDHLPGGSFRRMPTQKNIPWVLNHILESIRPHFAFIEREPFADDDLPYFDVGASTMCNSPEYFLWIHVPPESAETLIEKYSLERLQ